jgi:TorA maturation chaperone TorD
MSDRGLGEANKEAAVVSALARSRDITPPSTSNRFRASAAPVHSSDAATDVEPACIRPDLHNEHSGMTAELDEVDAARGREYALLSLLLARAPDRSLLDRLADLRGDESPLGVAHAGLAQAAGRTSAERVEREYFDLFIGLGRGELLPYGSYYLSGFLHERPLARLRAHLARLGIERADGQSEPEDHAAILCEVMAGLANGQLPAAAGADRELFEQHLSPWIGRFFADLERAEAADFYRPVATLGRVFIEIESAAFSLAPETSSAVDREQRR